MLQIFHRILILISHHGLEKFWKLRADITNFRHFWRSFLINVVNAKPTFFWKKNDFLYVRLAESIFQMSISKKTELVWTQILSVIEAYLCGDGLNLKLLCQMFSSIWRFCLQFQIENSYYYCRKLNFSYKNCHEFVSLAN